MSNLSRERTGKFGAHFQNIAAALPFIFTIAFGLPCWADTPIVEPYRQLFNQRDLQGWRPVVRLDKQKLTANQRETLAELARQDMAVHWQAAFGILQYDGGGKPIETEERFGPCRLSFQWKCDPCAASHIGLPGGWSIAIGDASIAGESARYASGAIYHNCDRKVEPILRADQPLGEWNQMMVHVTPHQIDVWLNGRRVAKLQDVSIDAKGRITLEGGPAPLYFRNLLIEPLSVAENDSESSLP
ncbi:MAG: DUF1080 domain-containing protein [Blastopirellula sp. JB062]